MRTEQVVPDSAPFLCWRGFVLPQSCMISSVDTSMDTSLATSILNNREEEYL